MTSADSTTDPAGPASDPLLTDFARGYDFPLDDYQLEACHHVAAGAGVLVAAPTGAGKTVVGEFAVWCALHQGRKCFYTTPIKALSNQKFRDLVERHGPDNVGLLTGDTAINGDAPVVVMTTEVLRNMIYARSSTLGNLGYVVMDEVHYLADRFRGPVWEEVIIGLAPAVQIVALSATVSNAEEFGEWLHEVRGRMEVVVSERRPVPLFQHVAVGRQIVDLFEGEAPTARELPGGSSTVNPQLVRLASKESRFLRDGSRRPRGRSGRGRRTVNYGSGQFGGAADREHIERAEEALATRPPSRGQLVGELERASLLPAIVFVFSRQGCDGAVRQLLGSHVTLTTRDEQRRLRAIAERHLGGLGGADRRALDLDRFIEGLTRGVAAHHAGILPACKAAVEEAFAAGLLKVVFATETLALGINMPARTVVLERLVKYNGETHADITPGEYTQLTGRAGRRGIDTEGHAVVVWQPGMDPRAVAGLASRRTYALRSAFRPTYNMAVNLIGSVGRERARGLLELSFAQFQTDRSVVASAHAEDRNQAAIADYLERATCERGDFPEYARLRERISELEAEQAKLRRTDQRAATLQSLHALSAGDIIAIPIGRRHCWAGVVNPGHGRTPHPLVVTEEREYIQLDADRFDQPVAPVGRMHVPRQFDPRKPVDRRRLAQSFLSKLSALDLGPATATRERAGVDEDLSEQIGRLRARLRQHPCHTCPDREQHARFAEQALRLERETSRLRDRAETRSNSIATRFDRVCGVLQTLGYLTEVEGVPGELAVTDEGRRLARVYSEFDLVAAECIREEVWDGLTAPQLAAVISSLVFEARHTDHGRPVRMPDAASERAQSGVRDVWRRVGLVERDQRLDRGDPPDIGFAETAYAWASGQSLADALSIGGLPAGDFVRWVRQVVDFAGQLAVAAGPGELRTTCRQVVAAMRRGVVDEDPDAD